MDSIIHKKAKEYSTSQLRDSGYSFGSKVINTAVLAGAALRIPGAKNLMKRRATKFAQNKVADGVSGVIAAKTGVDKKSVKNLVDGAGKMTGASKGINKVASTGSFDGTKVGRGFVSAGEGIKKIKNKLTSSDINSNTSPTNG
jgi:hypothetical protein